MPGARGTTTGAAGRWPLADRQMLARLQQALVLGLWLAAAAWAAWAWPRGGAWVLAGVVAVLLAHAWVLAVEFALLWRVQPGAGHPAHWGKDGLEQVMERPVSWVRHEANPHLKLLRRKQKDVPLIAVRGDVNRIHLALSTEKGAKEPTP